VLKLPRIDTLNLLSVYVGYKSWYEFKKNHLFANEVLRDLETSEIVELPPEIEIEEEINEEVQEKPISVQNSAPANSDLQTSTSEYQPDSQNTAGVSKVVN